MKFSFLAPALVLACLAAASCGNKKAPDPHADDVQVTIDETFRPIFEAELQQFQLQQPTAVLRPTYAGEVDAINALLQDSTRFIVVTRDLSPQEKTTLRNRYGLVARSQIVAYDAVALIVNKQNPDTLISLGDIKRVAQGLVTDWSQLKVHHQSGPIEVVFDNPRSSTVRYIEDSICGGRAMKGNLSALKSNAEVIDYVARNPRAIGIIGVDWLRNSADSTNLSFLSDIRVMSVSRSAVPEEANSFLPYQYYIATGDYPLTRAVYEISTDPRPQSMAYNFFYFVSDNKGQLIIVRNSQLLPQMPVQVKNVRAD